MHTEQGSIRTISPRMEIDPSKVQPQLLHSNVNGISDMTDPPK